MSTKMLKYILLLLIFSGTLSPAQRNVSLRCLKIKAPALPTKRSFVSNVTEVERIRKEFRKGV